MKYQLLKGNSENFKHPKTGLPVKLFRIIALKDFESKEGLIRENEVGGFIQSEKNLNQEDSSWVAQMAKVFDSVELVDSYISGDAKVFGASKISNSTINGTVRIYENAQVSDSFITDNVDIYGTAKISKSKMTNVTIACGKAELINSEMRDGTRISGNAKVKDSKLFEVAEVKGDGIIENCHLSGRTVWSKGTLRNESRNETIELSVVTNAS